MSLDQREEEATRTTSAADCGNKEDGKGFYLWLQVQRCSTLSPAPCVECQQDWAVLRGSPGSEEHFLVVPRDRVRGIECDKVLSGPDYWYSAARSIPTYFPPPHNPKLPPAAIGLGINSRYARQEEQLHIHMAPFVSSAQSDLEKLKSSIPTKWAEWPNKSFPVTGDSGQRRYRVLQIDKLGSSNNLFAILKDNVVTPLHLDMADETMILIQRVGGGWYVLNSDDHLSGGTSTCDHLLTYK